MFGSFLRDSRDVGGDITTRRGGGEMARAWKEKTREKSLGFQPGLTTWARRGGNEERAVEKHPKASERAPRYYFADTG